MRIAILHSKNRNDSISIGALVLQDDLQQKGHDVSICDYNTAFNYTHVLVSMTSTDDLFHIYKACKENNWENRTFTAYVGGFGCQNPIALAPFIDWAFFGRAEGIIADFIKEPEVFTEYSFNLSAPRKVKLRQVQQLYDRPVTYGKNHIQWKEKIVGCPYKCKFCHYSHNRKYVGNGGYMNDQLTTSAEVMLKDIVKLEKKPGRITAALDGYSKRLRYKFGKRISWQMVEDAMDHLSSFKGNTYFKLYNITNFPTETQTDRDEFFEFWKEYVQYSRKADGVVNVEVFNTAFRPSLNTPMERMEAKLYPEARQEIAEIAKGNGYNIKFTHLTRGAYSHLEDLISIRYTDVDIIDFIATNKEFNKLNNKAKLDYILANYDISPYIRRYDDKEELKFKFIA